MKTVVVIGAGHNGLAAAFYLAQAGLKPIVLERRTTVGGGAITGDLHPGFRCPTLGHHTSLWADIVREMDLPRHGLHLLTPDVDVLALSPEGPGIALSADVTRSAESIRRHSSRDADAYPLYRDAITRLAGVVASLLKVPPPDLDNPNATDAWRLLGTARRFRALGKKDAYRLLRWTPMAVADMAGEWFETDLLRATIAAPGLSGTMLGPRSAGSSLVLLLREANRLLCDNMSRVRGGPGALTAAMAAAATAAGAEIRVATPVDRIVAQRGRVTGVVSGTREIPVSAVVSAIDPKTTFLRLVDPIDVTPDFALKMRNFRASGTIAKINLALSALPVFTDADAAMLSGRIHVGPRLDDLERAFDHAKYGELPEEPWLDITIPSILDPDLAPHGAHVMSIYAHVVPYRLRTRTWTDAKATLLTSVLRLLERYAAGISALVVASHVISPEDLETEFGFAGGHPFHGELALDQLFAMRPLLGFGRYAGPLEGLYLCSAGTHPGGFMAGGSGRFAARELIRGAT